MIFHTGYYVKHSPKCSEFGCNCGFLFRGVRSIPDCCGVCNKRFECFTTPTPVIQAVAMVEVTKELRSNFLHPRDLKFYTYFRNFYTKLIANVAEDIKVYGVITDE